MTEARERLLVTVRTYPNPSRLHTELVCTGGITEQCEWRRLYPVPLRYLDEKQQYRTYDVIDVDVKPGKDGRQESRTPDNKTIKIIKHLDGWDSRCAWINPTIFPSLKKLQAANRTLGPVHVEEILEFVAKPVSAEWSRAQEEKLKQNLLYDEKKPLEKVPFEFRFRWRDRDGDEHNSLVIAWEFGQTWRKYRHKYDKPVEEMRRKWLNDICGPGRTISFFMGNMARFPRTFMVCGIFCPPKEIAESGKLW